MGTSNIVTMHTANAFVLIFAFAFSADVCFSYQESGEDPTFYVKTTIESTVQECLEDNDNCAKDPFKLMDLYEQLNSRGNNGTCNSLILRRLRKALVNTSALVLEEAYTSKKCRNESEVKHLSNRLFQCAPLISEAVFERFIDAVYVFADKMDLAELLYKNTDNFQQKVTSTLYFNMKFAMRFDSEPRLSSILAYYLRLLRFDKQFRLLPQELKIRVKKAILALPEQLQKLYFQDIVRLLNTGHWGYFYASHKIATKVIHQRAFTWTAAKNKSFIESDMKMDYSEGGNIAITSFINGKTSHLDVSSADFEVYFWMASGIPDNVWWEVYYHYDYFIFKNLLTGHLMCAVSPYDGLRFYVTANLPNSNMDIEEKCHWRVM